MKTNISYLYLFDKQEIFSEIIGAEIHFSQSGGGGGRIFLFRYANVDIHKYREKNVRKEKSDNSEENGFADFVAIPYLQPCVSVIWTNLTRSKINSLTLPRVSEICTNLT